MWSRESSGARMYIAKESYLPSLLVRAFARLFLNKFLTMQHVTTDDEKEPTIQ